jgi:hypothetical protein
MIADCHNMVSGNQIEGNIPVCDPESPKSPQVVIGDTDDSEGGDGDYNSSDSGEDLDGLKADNNQSVHSDSGLEENPHMKQNRKQKASKVQSKHDSKIEESPHAKKGK